jgi:predicted DNA-binding transcriptional regulator AlpA
VSRKAAWARFIFSAPPSSRLLVTQELVSFMTKTTKSVAVAKAAARKKARASVGVRLLSRREVLEKVPVSYPTIWKWMRERTFPRSRDIGGKVAWIEAEVDDWIANLGVVRLKGDAAETEAA